MTTTPNYTETLINYCLSFYGPSAGLYEDNFKNEDGTEGCSREEILKAIQELEKIEDFEFFGGSGDRELVRDVMLFRRGWDLLNLEKGQYIEKNLLGKPLSRERIKQYWEKDIQGFGIKITKQMRKNWEKRLDELEIFDN
jgi:hypothetical protein